MDLATLETLKRMIRPISLYGTLTLEQASSAANLNFDVARFQAAVAQAERILALAGCVDDRLEHELVARALLLTDRREQLLRDAVRARGGEAGASVPAQVAAAGCT
jgi:hypothetical protein